MGYQISYMNGGIRRENTTKGKRPERKRVLLFLSILAVLACFLLLRMDVVQQIIIPGDPLITKMALDNLLDALENGVGLNEAVTTFCQEIVRSVQ